MSRSTRFWLAVGTTENWDTAFTYGDIWGLKATQRVYWERLEENSDIVFFYATTPVSGVIGYGLIRTKLRQDSPLWPDERARNEVIWPLRFEFDVLYCLPRKFWESQRIVLPELKSRARSGFQEVAGGVAKELLKLLPAGSTRELARVAPSVVEREQQPLTLQPPAAGDSHRHTQQLLAEIGRLQKYAADVEYPLENRRLDVVWRRVQRAVPSFVFEVQVGGNLTEGLGKLKQAFDLWNSRIFLVGKDEHRRAVNELVGGTFHEIQPRLRFIQLQQVEELYQRKLAYREMESDLGILP